MMSPIDAAAVSDGPPRVATIVVPNPGPKTLDGTHTYVVGKDHAYIIDPGPLLPDHLANLRAWLRTEEIQPAGILLTHSHPDHAPAAPILAEHLGTPVYASTSMSAHTADELGVTGRLRDGDALLVDGEQLGVIETPGHAADHLAFWLPRAGILFSGDVILGRGTTLIAPPEGDMQLYLETLETLRRLPIEMIAPGHGPLVMNPAEKFEEYIEHRRRREADILNVLSDGPNDITGIVRAVYTDVDDRILPLAAGSVEAQLIKLEREGKVARNGRLYAAAN